MQILPIYHRKRIFLGRKDLVISFFTRSCNYSKCSFCTLPTRSATKNISKDEINSQTKMILNFYGSSCKEFEQFSIGNEGSILNESTFPQDSLFYFIL